MAESQKIWYLGELIRWSVDYLLEKGIDDARSSVEWMLCHVLDMSRVDLYMHFERPMSPEELGRYRRALKECAARRPVQQIIGETEFYGLRFAVNDQVLIPRPETEILVDRCLETVRALYGDSPLKILDIGAGSGALSVALAMHLPAAEITALEKSGPACAVLRQNLRFHNLQRRIEVVEADVFHWEAEEKFHLIVSNPPYISEGEMSALDRRVSHYEPYMSLSDGGDGLGFYRHFADRFSDWLLPGACALLEFGGHSQKDALTALFSDFSDVTVYTDYQKDPRVLKVCKGNS